MNRWRCVFLEEKTHLGRHLMATPTNSLVNNDILLLLQGKQWDYRYYSYGTGVIAKRDSISKMYLLYLY